MVEVEETRHRRGLGGEHRIGGGGQAELGVLGLPGGGRWWGKDPGGWTLGVDILNI